MGTYTSLRSVTFSTEGLTNGQKSVLHKLAERTKTHSQGFDFTISRRRQSWFEDLLRTWNVAFENVADSDAWVEKKVIGKNGLVRFFNRLRGRKQQCVAGVGVSDLVSEDFFDSEQGNLKTYVKTTCYSIAPTEVALRLRERER